MRIIGGTLKGRSIQVPAGLPVRPTTDRTREALFNILANRLAWEDVRMLDLFSGTGSVTWEAISRGAAEALCVDRHRACVKSLKELARQFGVQDQVRVVSMPAEKYVRQCDARFDFIFLDPPYAWPGIPALVREMLEKKLLAEGGWMVVEHAPQINLENLPGFDDRRVYGSSALSFFMAATA